MRLGDFLKKVSKAPKTFNEEVKGANIAALNIGDSGGERPAAPDRCFVVRNCYGIPRWCRLVL